MKNPSFIRQPDLYPTLDDIIAYFMDWIDAQDEAVIAFVFKNLILELNKKNGEFSLGVMGGPAHTIRRESITDLISRNVIHVGAYCEYNWCPRADLVDGVWQITQLELDQ